MSVIRMLDTGYAYRIGFVPPPLPHGPVRKGKGGKPVRW
jgi:hypothetical protein